MPGKIEYSLFLLENEFSRLENRINRAIKSLRREYEIEKRPTRQRAITEEIMELEDRLPEYRKRFEQWQQAEMERFDKHRWYRCPRCWLEHGRLSETKNSISEYEGFECRVKDCYFSALTPEGIEEQEDARRKQRQTPPYG